MGNWSHSLGWESDQRDGGQFKSKKRQLLENLENKVKAYLVRFKNTKSSNER